MNCKELLSVSAQQTVGFLEMSATTLRLFLGLNLTRVGFHWKWLDCSSFRLVILALPENVMPLFAHLHWVFFNAEVN